MYDFRKILVMRKRRRRIRSILRLRTITRSLLSWTGKKRVKLGSVVSRKTRRPIVKRMAVEKMISFLYFMRPVA
jgi:hypothetical protein